jgi:hypothetical protein
MQDAYTHNHQHTWPASFHRWNPREDRSLAGIINSSKLQKCEATIVCHGRYELQSSEQEEHIMSDGRSMPFFWVSVGKAYLARKILQAPDARIGSSEYQGTH